MRPFWSEVRKLMRCRFYSWFSIYIQMDWSLSIQVGFKVRYWTWGPVPSDFRDFPFAVGTWLCGLGKERCGFLWYAVLSQDCVHQHSCSDLGQQQTNNLVETNTLQWDSKSWTPMWFSFSQYWVPFFLISSKIDINMAKEISLLIVSRVVFIDQPRMQFVPYVS